MNTAEQHFFHDETGRAGELQAIRDGAEVELGASMMHARAVNLGIWGDRQMLTRDCAEILIGELRRAGFETPDVVGAAPLVDVIMNCGAFVSAFEHARHARELEAENRARGMTGNPPVSWDPPSAPVVSDDAVAAEVGAWLSMAG